MTSDLLYQYPPLIPGILIKRYKRFFADIQLANGEIITAHCPNTGSMTGVCMPGSAVQVSKTDDPSRKLLYTWEMIKVQDIWVGVNTGVPNRVIKLALEKKLFPELVYSNIKPEVPYGKDKKSRIDFLLTSDSLLSNSYQAPIYLEVKNTTLADNKIALFPDAVTLRGQKHLEELMALLPSTEAVMLYFINRSDCTQFAPGDHCDPVYGKLLRQAYQKGVKILPCRFAVFPQGIVYLGLAEVLL